MNKIIVTSQAEWDALPDSFEEFTVVEIGSIETITIKRNPTNSSAVLWGNSSAVLYGNSSAKLCNNSSAVLCNNSSAVLCNNSSAVLYGNPSAVLWGNSSAVLYGNSSAKLYSNSSAKLYLSSCAHVYSKHSKLNAFDNSTVYQHVNMPECSLKMEDSVNVILERDLITPSFEEWLSRGVVFADGIYRDLVKHKKLKDIDIYEVKEFNKDNSFVVKRGDLFSHGETVKQAIEDLKYKISDRDTTEFESWNIDTVVTQEKMIEAYRKITGACEFGVKDFLKSKKLKEDYSVKEVIDMTNGYYGHECFKGFFND